MTLKTTIPFLFSFSLAITTAYSQGFTNVSASSGVNMQHDGLPFASDMPIAGGAAWFDYDKDGWLDLYVTNRFSANKLYHNNQDGTFTDMAVALGVADSGGDGAGVVIGDINNDGYPDIFLANGDEDKLYKNKNGSSFTDITVGSGLEATFDSRGTSGSFGDYNKDGFLDLYVAHHIPTPTASGSATNQDFLFLNNGDETFTDVSSLLGISNLMDAAFIGGWTDYDHDNDLDIILINDCPISFYSNYGTRVFRNDGGTNPISDWTFTEVSNSVLPDCSNGMGIGIGDYDHDGWMDIVYTDIGPIQLYRNISGNFQEATSAGVGTQSTSHYSWGTSFFDYNNDMWQDIVVSLGGFWPDVNNGHHNNLFRNNGDGTFTDVANSMGIDVDLKTRTMVHGDYDNDGDLDIFMFNYDTICGLYRNDIVNSNNYMRLFLTGTTGNRDGLGAKIKLSTPDGEIQYFEMKSGTNLGGGDEMSAHFGLGSNTVASEVEVTWLSGAITTMNNLAANSQVGISEPLVLPVELTRFDVENLGEKVMIHWNTASETNNDYFEVQRSVDGVSFKKIGKIAAKEDSNSSNNYQLLDGRPQAGYNYYRLKQVDFDGSSSYSNTKSAFIKSDIFTANIYPNPANGNSLSIEFIEYKEGPSSIEIFDLTGRLVSKTTIEEPASEKFIKNISIEHLNNGMYLVKINNNTVIQTTKVLVNR